MAFTTITLPELVINKASFVFTSGLVEGASYNNIRTRCTIYIHGDIIAIIEQPQGLDNFNLTDILTSFCSKFSADFKSSTKIFTPISSGTNLFTGAWVNSGTWASFTSANELAVSGTAHASIDGYARSTAFALTKGDVVVVCFTIGSTQTATIYMSLTNSTTAGSGTVYEIVNAGYGIPSGKRMIYFTATENIANAYVWIWIVANTGAINYGLKVFKVSKTSMTTFNNPVCYFTFSYPPAIHFFLLKFLKRPNSMCHQTLWIGQL